MNETTRRLRGATVMGRLRWVRLLVASVLPFLAGCDAGGPSEDRVVADAAVAVEEAPIVVPGAEAGGEDEAGAAGTEMVREKAGVGVGERGRDLGDGPVSTPIKAYFTARERVAFEIQLPSTMQLFKAENGRAPRSHEEFMEKIIKGGAIRLPELPEGHRYVYDPEKEELLVEHP